MTPPALLVAVVALAVGGTAQVVHPDGRVGDFRIDVTTKAQIISALGKPAGTIVSLSEATGKRTGVRLEYACGRNCETVYSFSDRTGRLSDFTTGSPAFTTERGSRVGMPAARAAKLERKRLLPGCAADAIIHVRWDHTHAFAVSVSNGRVSEIAYIGPHSTYSEPFC